MAVIQTNAATLGLFLPTTKKKAILIQAYWTAVANSTVPGLLRVPTPPSLAANPNPAP